MALFVFVWAVRDWNRTLDANFNVYSKSKIKYMLKKQDINVSLVTGGSGSKQTEFSLLR